jgi:hypothetical protein
MPAVHWPALHISPGLQQPQPQGTTSGSQTIPTHWPLLQSCPQPQVGVQVLPGQRPFLQVPPPAQPQVPPQPSLPPQVPSEGQDGLQQVLW